MVWCCMLSVGCGRIGELCRGMVCCIFWWVEIVSGVGKSVDLLIGIIVVWWIVWGVGCFNVIWDVGFDCVILVGVRFYCIVGDVWCEWSGSDGWLGVVNWRGKNWFGFDSGYFLFVLIRVGVISGVGSGGVVTGDVMWWIWNLFEKIGVNFSNGGVIVVIWLFIKLVF